MTGRQIIGAAIRAAQPDWNVIDTARRLDAISRPTAVVWPVTMTRVDVQGLEWLRTTLDVWIVTPPSTPPATLEAALEGLALDLLDVLDTTPSIAWDTAERGVLDDAFHGWKVTATTIHRIERQP